MDYHKFKELNDFYSENSTNIEEVSPERRPTGVDDIDGMILLHNLLDEEKKERTHSIIVHSEHDEVIFGVSFEDLKETLTQQDVHDLNALGINYDSGKGCFYIFT